MSDEPAEVPDDGLFTPEIKGHSLEKIHHHNRYARIFASGMARKWPNLVYVGLYAGAGRAKVAGRKQIVETSALSVLRQPTLFTHYIYVDKDPRCLEALESRIAAISPVAQITLIEGDANDSVGRVRSAMPPFSTKSGVLSFCFIDPFDISLRFDTIKGLADLKMDFLILLMLGADARRNLIQYFNDPASTRIADFIATPEWRSEFQREGIVRYILRKFDERMRELRYLSAAEDLHRVKVAGKGVLLYHLAFYSKSKVGVKFWQESRAGISPQIGLDLD